jgi:hypothetical protein
MVDFDRVSRMYKCPRFFIETCRIGATIHKTIQIMVLKRIVLGRREIYVLHKISKDFEETLLDMKVLQFIVFVWYYIPLLVIDKLPI